MPYIKQDRREQCDPGTYDFRWPNTSGEFNFAITRLIVDYIGDKLEYDKINSAIGILECAKLELYRRIAAPYEDKKKEENGDVY
jgi:hypothetical protein